MTGPYAPYGSLSELLAAAGVQARDMDRYSTPQLLEMAARRAKPPAATEKEPAKMAWATRSIRIPFELERAVDRKARKAGTNLNAVVAKKLQEYVDGQ